MAESQKLDEVEKDGNRAPEVLSLQDAPAAVLSEDSLDPVYAAKAKVLNKAIQDIGMGRYQWQVRSITTSHPRMHASTPYRRKAGGFGPAALAKLV